MTLTEFLLARIGEDEAVATRIVVRRPLACPVCSQTVEEFITPAVINGYRPDRPDRCEPCGHELTEDQSADCLTSVIPTRVLAECEAKRRIVERASRSVVTVTSKRPSPFGNLSFSDGRYFDAAGRDVTDEVGAWHAVDGEPEDLHTLRALAAVYADHEGYDERWAL